MQTLQISSQKARQLYPTASAEFRAMLTDTFGETFFSQKITDRIKTFRDAYTALGIDPALALAPYLALPAGERGYHIAFAKLVIIARALNEGWLPNWNNRSEYKYFPWFDLETEPRNPTGFRFGASYCTDTSTHSAGGSRLCFKSRELSDYAGTQFADIYKEMMVIQPGQTA